MWRNPVPEGGAFNLFALPHATEPPMKHLPDTRAILLAAAFAASFPAHADPEVDAACQTTEFSVRLESANTELPHQSFRLEILPDSGRRPGNFIATITQKTTATIELIRPTVTCRIERTIEDCPAIAEVVHAAEQLTTSVVRNHAAPLTQITLHANTYRLQVRGTQGQHHLLSYSGEHENPIADFMRHARERLLTCVPSAILRKRDFSSP